MRGRHFMCSERSFVTINYLKLCDFECCSIQLGIIHYSIKVIVNKPSYKFNYKKNRISNCYIIMHMQVI